MLRQLADQRRLLAVILAAIVALGVVAVASGGPECVLIEYGGVLQPDEPRTTCDPPWSPSAAATIMPEEAPPSIDPSATPDFSEGPSDHPVPDNGGDDPGVPGSRSPISAPETEAAPS